MTRTSLNGLEGISHDMERVFDSLLGRTVGTVLRPDGAAPKFSPALDVAETDASFEVIVDLPGVDPDGVTVEMQEGKLMVSGERPVPESEKGFHRMERPAGKFCRMLALPNDVDVDNIEARYELGVLSVTIPKLAKVQPKKIEIRRG